MNIEAWTGAPAPGPNASASAQHQGQAALVSSHLDDMSRHAVLARLADLEEAFYDYIDYLEKDGEEDIVRRLQETRRRVQAGTFTRAELAKLSAAVDRVRRYPVRMKDAVTEISDRMVAGN